MNRFPMDFTEYDLFKYMGPPPSPPPPPPLTKSELPNAGENILEETMLKLADLFKWYQKMGYNYNDILEICQGFNSLADVLVILIKRQGEANDLGDKDFWCFDETLSKETSHDMHTIGLAIYHLDELEFIDVIRNDERSGSMERAYCVYLDKIQEAIDKLKKV